MSLERPWRSPRTVCCSLPSSCHRVGGGKGEASGSTAWPATRSAPELGGQRGRGLDVGIVGQGATVHPYRTFSSSGGGGLPGLFPALLGPLGRALFFGGAWGMEHAGAPDRSKAIEEVIEGAVGQ